MAMIFLHGDCLIGKASELHQLFIHHLSQTEEALEIDLSATGRCDVSFFQLLCAASRSFAQKNKRLSLIGLPPETVVKQFENAGWGQSCAGCPESGCFFKDVMVKEQTP